MAGSEETHVRAPCGSAEQPCRAGQRCVKESKNSLDTGRWGRHGFSQYGWYVERSLTWSSALSSIKESDKSCRGVLPGWVEWLCCCRSAGRFEPAMPPWWFLCHCFVCSVLSDMIRWNTIGVFRPPEITRSRSDNNCRLWQAVPATWISHGVYFLSSFLITIITEICKAPTLRLKALNKRTHIMYIEMENVIQNKKIPTMLQA